MHIKYKTEFITKDCKFILYKTHMYIYNYIYSKYVYIILICKKRNSCIIVSFNVYFIL